MVVARERLASPHARALEWMRATAAHLAVSRTDRTGRTGPRCTRGLRHRGSRPGTIHSSRRPVRRLRLHRGARVPRTGRRCRRGPRRTGNLQRSFHSSRRRGHKRRRHKWAQVARTGRRCTRDLLRTGNPQRMIHNSRRRERRRRPHKWARVARTARRNTRALRRTGNLPGTITALDSRSAGSVPTRGSWLHALGAVALEAGCARASSRDVPQFSMPGAQAPSPHVGGGFTHCPCDPLALQTWLAGQGQSTGHTPQSSTFGLQTPFPHSGSGGGGGSSGTQQSPGQSVARKSG